MRQDKAATAPSPNRQGALTVSEYRWQDSWETRLEIRPWGVTRSKIPALGQVGDTGAFALCPRSSLSSFTCSYPTLFIILLVHGELDVWMLEFGTFMAH